jgi:hypothetical protein
MKDRRSIAVVAALTCAVLLMPAGPSVNAAPCGAATEIQDFTVTAKVSKKAYRMGETVNVEVTVVIPGPNDPVTGQPFPSPTYVPAEGVETGATFYTSDDDLPVFGRGITDAQGKSTVPVKLERGDAPRSVYATVSAQRWTNRGGCPDVVETGYKDYPKFFKLAR